MLVTERLREIQDSYLRLRPTAGPTNAFDSALDAVLAGADRRKVAAFIAGELHEVYPRSDGAEFGRGIADHLEDLYQKLRANDERGARRELMNAAQLAEDLAADPDVARWFTDAAARGDSEEAARIVGLAATYIVEKAQNEWPPEYRGWGVKVEQAAEIFDRLARMSTNVPGDDRAACQTVWCAAVRDALRSY